MWPRLIIGVVLVVVGGVWIGQGLGAIGGSFMTGHAEWAVIGPLIPPAKRGGNKRTVEVREVVNGVMYVLSTGCQWAHCRGTCRPAVQ